MDGSHAVPVPFADQPQTAIIEGLAPDFTWRSRGDGPGVTPLLLDPAHPVLHFSADPLANGGGQMTFGCTNSYCGDPHADEVTYGYALDSKLRLYPPVRALLEAITQSKGRKRPLCGIVSGLFAPTCKDWALSREHCRLLTRRSSWRRASGDSAPAWRWSCGPNARCCG